MPGSLINLLGYMKIKALLTLNILMAFGSSIYIWNMLPFAHGVACEASKSCEDLSITEHLTTTITPVVIVMVLLFCFFKVKETHTKSAMVLLLIYPALILGVFLNVAVKP
ncbi:MAG: hypothetical protein P8Z72_16575 [Gammaproteobacteria bacterium]